MVQDSSADLTGNSLREIQSRLQRLERRDWWLWAAAIIVMLLLVLAVVSLTLPSLSQDLDSFSRLHQDQAVRGLLGLVFLFSIHVVYQQILVRRLRRQLARQLELMAAQEARTEQFRQLSLVDPLTDLYNRRFLQHHLAIEVARAQRQGHPLSALILDLDNFKVINDHYGHAAGDLVLSQFAIHLKKAIRSSDLPVRVGGDEFLVLLPECRPDHVPNVLSRLKGLEADFHGQKIPYAVSAGWAEYQQSELPERFLERADQALLADKRTGNARAEVQKLETQIRQADRMEAVGRLAGGVAHDFNNLLMVMHGCSELLLNHLPAGDPLRLNAEEVRKAAERATSLTQQLLAFSRKQVLHTHVLDLNAVVVEMDELLRRVIGEDIERITLLRPNLGRVKSDPKQIEQVILNLAVNARDAMPQGGKLTIETSNVELDEASARKHGGVAPGSYVLMAVSDTGCGMDEETLSHIFEPFFTTKGKNKGTGLGLATAYGIMRQSGGSIRASSQPGQGTTFKILLPHTEAPGEEASQEKAIVALPQGSETILVVEDEMSVRRLAREFLEEKGYHVLEAMEGGEALRTAEKHQGPIHLLLTDVVMPRMSGRELARCLVPLRPEMKVIYMSGYTDHSIVRQGDLERDAAFLQKPFTLDALARRVREVLDSQSSQEKQHPSAA